jgi:2-isopropylmalate synthase
MVGLQQRIRVGPMSGKSNVDWVLRGMGIDPTPALVDSVLAVGKSSKRLLTEDEIRRLV